MSIIDGYRGSHYLEEPEKPKRRNSAGRPDINTAILLELSVLKGSAQDAVHALLGPNISYEQLVGVSQPIQNRLDKAALN